MHPGVYKYNVGRSEKGTLSRPYLLGRPTRRLCHSIAPCCKLLNQGLNGAGRKTILIKDMEEVDGAIWPLTSHTRTRNQGVDMMR